MMMDHLDHAITLNSNDSNETVGVSVVVPVYNQARNITTTISKIKNVMESSVSSYELLIVNDGSKDETQRELQRYDTDKSIRIISYEPNRGKGYAVKTGIMNSSGNLVLFIDGDLDISPTIIKDYVEELSKTDIAIGSKRHPLSRVHTPPSRRFLSKSFNLLVKITTGIKVSDTQSGIKAGKGRSLKSIFSAVTIKRYAFDVEFLTIATILGLKISELPVQLEIDSGFKIREILRMFADVIIISYKHRLKHWYSKQLCMHLWSLKMGNTKFPPNSVQ